MCWELKFPLTCKMVGMKALLLAVSIPFVASSQSIEGTWIVRDVAFAPWTFTLRVQGSEVQGTVSQGPGDSAAGLVTTLTKPVEIRHGLLSGSTVSFDCLPLGESGRTVQFRGELQGNEIAFTREVVTPPGKDPGQDGVFGASGLARFAARRATRFNPPTRPADDPGRGGVGLSGPVSTPTLLKKLSRNTPRRHAVLAWKERSCWG